MNECFVFTQNARKHLERVFRPCHRYKKHTMKPPPWPIDLNLCPASWLRVTAGLLLRPTYTSVYPSLFHYQYTYPRPVVWYI